MAENIPNLPTGAVPPKPAEPAKVKPKKETVRISLPPKPTAAPTVRIPVPAMPSAAVAAAAAPTSAAAPAQTPAPAPATATGAPAPRPAPASPTLTSAPRPAAAPARPAAAGSGLLENILAVTAAVLGLVALAGVFLLMNKF